MAGILNAGARVLRITRIQIINTTATAVSGTLSVGEIRRYTGVTSWSPTTTSVVTTPYDSTNSALSSVTIGHSALPTTSVYEVVKPYTVGNDEVTLAGITLGAINGIPLIGTVWDLAFAEGEMQHLTIRNNEMLMLFNWIGAAGTADFWIEFTDAAT